MLQWDCAAAVERRRPSASAFHKSSARQQYGMRCHGPPQISVRPERSAEGAKSKGKKAFVIRVFRLRGAALRYAQHERLRFGDDSRSLRQHSRIAQPLPQSIQLVAIARAARGITADRLPHLRRAGQALYRARRLVEIDARGI